MSAFEKTGERKKEISSTIFSKAVIPDYKTFFMSRPEFFGNSTSIEERVRSTSPYFSRQTQESIINAASSSKVVIPVLGDGALNRSLEFVPEFSLFGNRFNGKPGASESDISITRRFLLESLSGMKVGGVPLLVSYCPHLKNHYCRYQDENVLLGKLHHNADRQPHRASDEALAVLNGGKPSVERLREGMEKFVSSYEKVVEESRANLSSSRMVATYEQEDEGRTITPLGRDMKIYELEDSSFLVSYTTESIMGKNYKEYEPISVIYIDLTYLMGNVNCLYEYMDIALGIEESSTCIKFYEDAKISRNGFSRSIFESSATPKITARQKSPAELKITKEVIREQERELLMHDAAVLQKFVVHCCNLVFEEGSLAQPYTYAHGSDIFRKVFEILEPALRGNMVGIARLGYCFQWNDSVGAYEPKVFDPRNVDEESYESMSTLELVELQRSLGSVS